MVVVVVDIGDCCIVFIVVGFFYLDVVWVVFCCYVIECIGIVVMIKMGVILVFLYKKVGLMVVV